MKNVLIVMLVLVVTFSALGISLTRKGLAYEENLKEFLFLVDNFTGDIVDKISFVGDIVTIINGSDVYFYNDYKGFAVYYWDDGEGVRQYLIFGFKSRFRQSREVLYCTISDEIVSADWVWSWKHLSIVFDMCDISGNCITKVSMRDVIGEFFYSSAQKLSDYMATIPALAEFREEFEAGR